MKPDKLSVHDLFQKERRYVVPLYQRAYVWSHDEQWEPLWEDIERQAEACLEAPDNVAPRSHFLGAIVLNVAKIVGASVARSEVIDGQQRLTTLQLFVAALRDYAKSVGSLHAGKLTRLTINEDEKPGSEASFKVWPTNADRAMFRVVMTSGSPAAVMHATGASKAVGLTRIAGAYEYFSRKIVEFVDLEAEATDPEFAQEARDRRIFGLLQALRTALQFVVIELEDTDDPQVIFETLNARGQPLLPSDLIRNYVFLQATNDPSLDANSLYDTYWRPFDDTRITEPINGEDRFWHVEERQGRLTRPRIDLFMFHYLVMKTERDLNIGSLFREFRDWRTAEPTSTEAYLADLMAHSHVFAKLVAPSGNDRLSVFAQRLKALDNSTIYPLLLFLLSLPADRLSITGRNQILDDLESWLVRRFVCVSTNKNYNKFFVGLLGRLKHAENTTSLPEMVRYELTMSTDVTRNWPDDDEFRRGWLTKPVYVRSRTDRSAVILQAIEEYVHTTRNEAVILPANLSVEHLLPQKGSLADYPYAEPMPLDAGETYAQCRTRVIHTIGNLTLLTRELNASASNGPFLTKVEKIVADSDLRLNAWLRNNPPSQWSETDILKRGEELFTAAVNIWVRPGAAGRYVTEAAIPEASTPKTKAEVQLSLSKTSTGATWREDVRDALRALGGQAALGQIYAKVEAIRRTAGRSVPPSLDATIRQTLEASSSDSDSHQGVYDWFYMPEGKGAGIWALR